MKTKAQLTCDRCGASKTDPIAPCKRLYQNSEVTLCDRCKDSGQWKNLEPIIWVGQS